MSDNSNKTLSLSSRFIVTTLLPFAYFYGYAKRMSAIARVSLIFLIVLPFVIGLHFGSCRVHACVTPLEWWRELSPADRPGWGQVITGGVSALASLLTVVVAILIFQNQRRDALASERQRWEYLGQNAAFMMYRPVQDVLSALGECYRNMAWTETTADVWLDFLTKKWEPNTAELRSAAGRVDSLGASALSFQARGFSSLVEKLEDVLNKCRDKVVWFDGNSTSLFRGTVGIAFFTGAALLDHMERLAPALSHFRGDKKNEIEIIRAAFQEMDVAVANAVIKPNP